jgi:hypothetical protein
MLCFDPWISYLIQLQIAIEYKEHHLAQLHETLLRLSSETELLEKDFLTISHTLNLLSNQLP